MHDTQRAMILPPPDRPSWLQDNNDDLLYLGWGRRFYYRQPIPVTGHIGWAYLVVVSGRPRLALSDREIPAPAGTLFQVGPDCATGWVDNPGRTCRILSWIWRNNPPGASRLNVLRSGFVDRDALARLEQLHRDSRREVAMSDQHSNDALRGLRAVLDVEYARALQGEPRPALAERQLAWAVNWMHQHLDSGHPVQALREYLDMTRAELGLLFRGGTSMSPHGYFQMLRMERAYALLLEGQQAKSVARSLGYGHPNDLSRAFQRYFGCAIREKLANA
jgi:AraC-like DNA-binding protein